MKSIDNLGNSRILRPYYRQPDKFIYIDTGGAFSVSGGVILVFAAHSIGEFQRDEDFQA